MPLPKRVFIIDDDVDDMHFLRMALNEVIEQVELYYEIESDLAISKLKEGSIPAPDIIFLDLNMPKLNGWACLVAIKNMPSYKGIPIVIFSTSTDKNDVVSTAKLGASHFITKPSTYTVIVNTLAHLFNGDWQEPTIQYGRISETNIISY